MVNTSDRSGTSATKTDRGDVLAATSLLPRASAATPVEWRISDTPVAYPDALAFMDARVAAIAEGRAAECVWLLEHPPLYTAGTSAKPADLVDPERFPVYATGRGGQYTYHGPGQRIAYVMLDLKRRGPEGRAPDIRAYVGALEEWLIRALWRWHIRGERRDDRVGIWVRRPNRPAPPGAIAEDKVAALGIRVRHWVTLHGISLNVEPELDHFGGIVPCGIADHGVTSLADLGLTLAMPEVDMVLREEFTALFGPTTTVPAG